MYLGVFLSFIIFLNPASNSLKIWSMYFVILLILVNSWPLSYHYLILFLMDRSFPFKIIIIIPITCMLDHLINLGSVFFVFNFLSS